MSMLDFRLLFDRITNYVQVDDETDCYVWTGTVNDRGYPVITVRGRTLGVHRLVYGWAVDIPQGHHVHHRCRNRRCIFVGHMEVLAQQDHVREHPKPIGVPRAARPIRLGRQRSFGAVCNVCGGKRKQLRSGRWFCAPCNQEYERQRTANKPIVLWCGECGGRRSQMKNGRWDCMACRHTRSLKAYEERQRRLAGYL